MNRNRRFIISGFLVLSLALFGGAYALAKTTADSSVQLPNSMNANGQTYGTVADTGTPDEAPKLIACIGVNGTEGYCYKSDMEGTLAKTPEEAVQLMAQLEKSDYKRTIPLYEADGETVIGTFNIG